jgi:hypothetical protein
MKAGHRRPLPIYGFPTEFGPDTTGLTGTQLRVICFVIWTDGDPLCMLWCIPGFLHNHWSHAFELLRETGSPITAAQANFLP